MLIRVNKKHKRVMSLQENLGQDKDGNEVELLDIIPSLDDEIYGIVEGNIITEKIINLIDKVLSKREATILKMRYGIGGIPALTQREVAVELGISRSYISRLETKALATIKEHLKDIDCDF